MSKLISQLIDSSCFVNAQETLSTLFSLYIRDLGPGANVADPCWLGRQGVALALHSAADVLRTKDLPVVMTFLIGRALVSFLFLLLCKKKFIVQQLIPPHSLFLISCLLLVAILK